VDRSWNAVEFMVTRVIVCRVSPECVWVGPRFALVPAGGAIALGRTGATFEDIVVKVRDDMGARKADYLGLGELAFGALILKGLSFAWAQALLEHRCKSMVRTRVISPDFTNVRNIDAEHLVFGGVEVNGAFPAPSVAFPPIFGMGLSGFRESLTLGGGFCEAATEKPVVERFLGRMANGLSG
jgi:NRPS condensation-like uncharacterized protein